jgi:O-antigen/teichoic acid export membrane protein
MLKAASHPVFRMARNAVSVLASDALNRATTFILYALVARYLDARAFGQLSLALAFFYAFQVFASLGLPTLATREVASDEDQFSPCLMNGGLLTLGGSLLSIVLLLGCVVAMGYATDTALVILLMALGLVPHALAGVGEAVLRGREQMHLIAVANVPANLGKVAAAWWLLQSGHGVYAMAWVVVGSRTVTLATLAAIILRQRERLRMALSLHAARQMLRRTSVFLGIDGLIAIWASVNILLLSALTSEEQVGLFNSASQLLTPFLILNMSITASVFPLLCRRFQGADREASLGRLGGRLLDTLLVVAVPCSVGMFWLAEEALALAYGNREFTEAALALRILAAGVVLRAITTALGQMLLASLQERVTLRIVLVNVAVSFTVSLVLIERYGVLGAAAAAVLTQLMDVFQHLWPVSRMLPEFRLWRHLWKPAVASLAMAGALTLVQGHSVLVHVAVGAAVYTAVAAPLLLGKRLIAACGQRAGLRENLAEL